MNLLLISVISSCKFLGFSRRVKIDESRPIICTNGYVKDNECITKFNVDDFSILSEKVNLVDAKNIKLSLNINPNVPSWFCYNLALDDNLNNNGIQDADSMPSCGDEESTCDEGKVLTISSKEGIPVWEGNSSDEPTLLKAKLNAVACFLHPEEVFTSKPLSLDTAFLGIPKPSVEYQDEKCVLGFTDYSNLLDDYVVLKDNTMISDDTTEILVNAVSEEPGTSIIWGTLISPLELEKENTVKYKARFKYLNKYDISSNVGTYTCEFCSPVVEITLNDVKDSTNSFSLRNGSGDDCSSLSCNMFYSYVYDLGVSVVPVFKEYPNEEAVVICSDPRFDNASKTIQSIVYKIECGEFSNEKTQSLNTQCPALNPDIKITVKEDIFVLESSNCEEPKMSYGYYYSGETRDVIYKDYEGKEVNICDGNDGKTVTAIAYKLTCDGQDYVKTEELESSLTCDSALGGEGTIK